MATNNDTSNSTRTSERVRLRLERRRARRRESYAFMTTESRDARLTTRRERYNAMTEETREDQLRRRREIYNAMSEEERQEQLVQRRERYNAVGQEAREEQLGQRRELDRLARQQESSEDRDIRLRRRREQRQAAPLTSEFDAYSKFREDMLVRLEHCHICQCMMFTDKSKSISLSLLLECQPDSELDNGDDAVDHEVDICSKCNTNITKQKWPTLAPDNGLEADSIPPILASLTADEVRIISIVIPFLKVVVLPGGQFGEEGSVIHFPFPVTEVYRQLPSPLTASEIILSSVGVSDRETFSTLLESINLQRVHDALVWLKDNNSHYASIINTTAETTIHTPMLNLEQTLPLTTMSTNNIQYDEPMQVNTIDETMINLEQTVSIHDTPMYDTTNTNTAYDSIAHIPNTHDNATDSILLTNSNNAFLESCAMPQNYVEPDITINELLQRQNSAPLFPFPHLKSSPVNTFENKDIEAMAFPILYPQGRFHIGYERNAKITDLQYFQCRLYHKDPRWRDSTLWLFWGLNTFETRKLQSEISIMSRIKKQNLQPLTAGDIQNPTNTDDSLQNNSYMFMKNIRGTPAYWKDQLLDLLARINTLGPPTFFLTLTANDMHWPELFQLIDNNLTNEEISQMTSCQKLELLRRHPLHAVMFFERRLDSFINNIIKGSSKPLGNVNDYWLRIEFQMRGCPHVHSFWWIDGAPNLDSVEGRQQAPSFIDQYIHTTYPDENDTELYRLVNTLQVHSHSPTCYKYNHRTCRFDFPRPVSPNTRLRINSDPGSAARFYVTKRQEQDQWINAYNPVILRTWQANMDIQMVGSQYGAAMYVCMYVSKAEPERLKNALSETIQNIPNDASQRKRLSMIGATVLTHRQISSQEAIYRLGGFKLVRSTRSTVSLSCSKPENRKRILKSQREIAELPESSTNIFQPGIIDYYQNRPNDPSWDNISLATFATTYTVSSKENNSIQKLNLFDMWIHKRRKPACLRIPQFSNTTDEYYYSLLMLFKPYRNESELLQENETSRDAFMRQMDSLDTDSAPYLNMAQEIQLAIVRIQLLNASTPLDIAAQVAPTLTSLEGAMEHFHDNSNDHPQWLHDACMATATVENNENGTRTEQENPLDTSLSWAQTFTRTMTDTQYSEALSNASSDQKYVIDMIYQHNRNYIINNTMEQLLLFVTGGAGVGKSFIIRTVQEMLIRMEQQNPILLTAPTGIAAYNIGGITIHSAFSLPVEHHKTADYIPLRAEKLQTLRYKFRNIRYIIIDEISMVSCQNFVYIHNRLCEIKDTTHDPSILFGGMSILTFGDLFQLKPVHGSYIFDKRKPESFLWQHFKPAFLTTNHRQAEDKSWAETLNRIRIGQPSESDIANLNERKNIDVTVPPFNTALRIYPTRKQVKEYNAQRLTELTSSQPSLNVYDIAAHDTMISAPGYLTDEQIQSSKSSDESETAGLTQTLHLANGSRVMLLRNTFTDEGLVNGAQGTVQGIEWGDESQIIPRGVYVLFDNPLIGQSLRHNSNNELHNSILIRPITANFYGKFNVHWSRTQIPLTPCWATTVHKVQGITLQHAVIDIGSTVFTSGMSYVALSRIQNITGLAIQNLDTKKLKASDIVITEMGRLLQLNTNSYRLSVQTI